MIKIAIIGGTGLEDPNFFESSEQMVIDTPYGKPSSDLLIGKILGIDIVLLSRHGKKHCIPPTSSIPSNYV